MKKNNAILLALLTITMMAMAPIAYNANALPTQNKNSKLVPKAIGISPFTKYDWTIAISTLDYSVSGPDIPFGTEYILEQVKNAIGGLELGKMVMVFGKTYPTDKVAYVTPFIITGTDIYVTPEFISLAMNISLTDAQDLAFTIPKGSGIAPTLFMGLIFLGASGPMGPMMAPMLTALNTPNGIEPTQIDFSTIPTITAALYNYTTEAIGPPAPILDPNAFSFYKSMWPMMTQELPDGIEGSVVETDDTISFMVSGTNTTVDDITTTVTVDFVATYNKTTGILRDLYLSGQLEMTDGTNTITGDLEFAMGFTGSTSYTFGLTFGEQIGFTPGYIDYTDALINLLQQFNENITKDVVDEFIANITAINTTLTYDDINSVSGIDLFYDVFIDAPWGQSSDKMIASDLMFGAPYVLPAWDEMASVSQLEQFIVTSVLGKFLKYQIESLNPTMTLSITGDYAFLLHGTVGNFDYASSYNTLNIMVQNVTGSTDPQNLGFRIKIKVTSWMTYDNEGFLTEIGFNFNISELVFDSDGDGDFTDEFATFHGYVELSINRVASTSSGYGTMGLDFSTIIDPPDPDPASPEWTDFTPKEQPEPPGETPDTAGPSITDVSYYPDKPPSGEQVKVTAKVSDESTILQVVLSYETEEGWVNVTMTFNETSGLYEAYFVMPNATKINAKIYAEDIYHNWSVEEFVIGQEAGGFLGGQNMVYIGGGALALIILLSVIFVLTRRRG